MAQRPKCPECGSGDVDVCEPHPTAVGWHVIACNGCGHTGGDHRKGDTCQQIAQRMAG
jgi:hypothetical protein